MSCSSNNRQIQTIDTPSNELSVMEKHIVSITKDNYQKFLTVEINSVSSVAFHYFRGALSYAYYDNVVITYNLNYSDRTPNKTGQTLPLNVGGCGTITTVSTQYGSSSYEITDVSGSIIYWI